jgi:hypothetical protein
MISYLLFIPFFVTTLPIFCSNKLISDRKNIKETIPAEYDFYFKPYLDYKRKLSYNPNLIKPVDFDTLAEHFKQKDMIKSAYIDYCDFYKEHPPKSGLMKSFWNPKKITAVLAFRTHYDQAQSRLNAIKDQFESIKFPVDSDLSSTYNATIQESVDQEIKPLQTEYQESYEFYQEKAYTNNETEFEIVKFKINWPESCRTICRSFLKKISGITAAADDPDIQSFEFLPDKAVDVFLKATNNKRLNDQNRPNVPVMQHFFQTIIMNNPVFSGCVAFVQSLTKQGYPPGIRTELMLNLVQAPIVYYERRLTGNTDIEPDKQIEKIEREAMSLVSIALDPMIITKLRKQFPDNQVLDGIAEIIRTQLFKGKTYANYHHLESLIDYIVKNIVLPVDKSQIDIFLCETPEEIQRAHQGLIKVVQNLACIIKDLEQNQAGLLIEIESLNDSLETSQVQLEISKVHSAKLDNQIKINSQKLEKLQASLADAEKSLKLLQPHKEKLQSEIDILTTQKRSLTEQETVLNKNITALTNQNSELNTTNATLNSEKDKLQSEVTPLQNKIRALKTIVCLLGVVATFLFLATLIQGKYLFLH